MCGCLKIEEAKRTTVAADDDEGKRDRENLIEIGEGMAEAWGCPMRGHKPPEKLREDLGDSWSRVREMTGADLPRTCPWSSCSSELVLEITDAVSLTEWNVPLETTLGRPLTKVDTEALITLRRSRVEAAKANHEQRERDLERERNAAAARAKAGGLGDRG